MTLPTPKKIKKYLFGSKRRTAVAASFLVILTITIGVIFNKQLEKLFYGGLGKIFPGSHINVEGTSVTGFSGGKRVDYLTGTVTIIEPSNIGTRLTIKQEGDSKIVIIDPKAVIFSEKKEESEFVKGTAEEIEIGDSVTADFLETRPNGEVKAGFVIVRR
jgi:hypothetical protein